MNPFRRIWLRLTGQPVPDPYEDIHRETAELIKIARILRHRLESYQRAEDPFVAMIQDAWNRRQMNGSAYHQ